MATTPQRFWLSITAAQLAMTVGVFTACGNGLEPDAIDLATVVTGGYRSSAELLSSSCQPAAGASSLVAWPADYEWEVRVERGDTPAIALPFYYKLTTTADTQADAIGDDDANRDSSVAASRTVCARGVHTVRLSQHEGFEKAVDLASPEHAACAPASARYEYRITSARHDRIEARARLRFDALASGCDRCFVGPACDFEIRYTYELTGSCAEPCSVIPEGKITDGTLVQKIGCKC